MFVRSCLHFVRSSRRCAPGARCSQWDPWPDARTSHPRHLNALTSAGDIADVGSCRKWLLDICLGGFKAVAEARFGDQVPRIGWFGRRRYRQQRSSESWSWLLQ